MLDSEGNYLRLVENALATVRQVCECKDCALAEDSKLKSALEAGLQKAKEMPACRAEDPLNCKYHKTGKYAEGAKQEPSPMEVEESTQKATPEDATSKKTKETDEQAVKLSDGTPITLTEEGKQAKSALEQAIEEASDPWLKAKLVAIQKEAEEKLKNLVQGGEPKEMPPGDAPGETQPEKQSSLKLEGVSSPQQEKEIHEKVEKLNHALEESNFGTHISQVSANPFYSHYIFDYKGSIPPKMLANLRASFGSDYLKVKTVGANLHAVEIQNDHVANVSFSQLTADEGFAETAEDMIAPCVIGRGINGRGIVVDLSDMKHLLIGGKTGEGKSSVLNSIIMGMMKFKSPKELEMNLIDPQRVEFEKYKDLPQVKNYIGGVDGENTQKVSDLLDDTIKEMEDRTTFFAKLGVSNLKGYQAYRSAHPERNLPQLPARILCIDEYPMLLSSAEHGIDIAQKVKRLSNEARKAGIHMVIAAQDPKLASIGDIKANTTKIALKTETSQASRNILDVNGAENLTGKGDLLLKIGGGKDSLVRAKGAFINDQEDSNGKSELKTEIETVKEKWGKTSDEDASTSASSPPSASAPKPTTIFTPPQEQEKRAPASTQGSESTSHLGFWGALKRAWKAGQKGQTVNYDPMRHHASMASNFEAYANEQAKKNALPDLSNHPLHKILGTLPPSANEAQQEMAKLYREKLDQAILQKNPTALRMVQKQYINWVKEEGLDKPQKGEQTASKYDKYL